MKNRTAMKQLEDGTVGPLKGHPITAGGRATSTHPRGALATKDVKFKVHAVAFQAISKERAARRAKGSQSKGSKGKSK